MKRSLWTETLTEHHAPSWPCPGCHKGALALVQKSLVYKETAASKRAHSDDAWEPEWIEYAFTAWLKCNRTTCNQEVAVSGNGEVEMDYDPEDEDMVWSPYFIPKFCWPMPNMFELPAKCPDGIEKELRAAFSLFWFNTGAAANKTRTALENLMDHLGIKKRYKVANGKFAERTLHQRIEVFQKREPVIGAQLMALKWLGNTGSHEGEVSRDDVLDAFEILEHALGELIDQRTAKVAALARKLMKKHGKKK